MSASATSSENELYQLLADNARPDTVFVLIYCCCHSYGKKLQVK